MWLTVAGTICWAGWVQWHLQYCLIYHCAMLLNWLFLTVDRVSLNMYIHCVELCYSLVITGSWEFDTENQCVQMMVSIIMCTWLANFVGHRLFRICYCHAHWWSSEARYCFWFSLSSCVCVCVPVYHSNWKTTDGKLMQLLMLVPKWKLQFPRHHISWVTKWVIDWVCSFSPQASSAMLAAKETKFATKVA